jgi:hypothetical protein
MASAPGVAAEEAAVASSAEAGAQVVVDASVVEGVAAALLGAFRAVLA